MSSAGGTESGEVQLDPKAVRSIAGAVREWTNRTHAAVMAEVETLAADLPSTRSGLELARVRVADARARAESRTGSSARRLVDLLAVAALEEHLAACAGTGRWRRPTARVLDQHLPRRSGRDTYFRVPDELGRVPAGLTLDYDSLVWIAEPSGDRPAAAARDTPLALIAFAHLRRVRWRAGMGGEILGADGHPVLTFP